MMSQDIIPDGFRKCKQCGKILPLSAYSSNGKGGYRMTCKTCRKPIVNLQSRRYYYRKKMGQKNMTEQTSIQFVPQKSQIEQQDPAVLYAHIKHVTDDEILREVARRGFHGELQYSKTVKV